MATVLVLVQREWRVLLRRSAALVLLVALAGGVTLAAAAGARRTGTSFTRMLRRYPGPDVIIPNAPDPTGRTAVFDEATVRALPGVRLVAGSEPLFLLIHGQPVLNVAHVEPDLGSPGTIGEYKIVSGRQVDPNRLDEAIANYDAAQQFHIHVGDVLPFVPLPPFDGFLRRPGVQLPTKVRVIGTYVGPGEIFSEEQQVPLLHFSAALARLYPPFVAPGMLVFLDRGQAGVPAFVQALSRTAGGKRVVVDVFHSADRDKQNAVHIQALGIWLLTGLVGLTGLLTVTQALLREAAADAPSDQQLAALGMTRWQLFWRRMGHALATLLAGGVLGFGVMYALSPILPFGVARLAEPHPGRFGLDWTVAGLGLLAIVVLPVAAIGVPVFARVGHAMRLADADRAPRHGDERSAVARSWRERVPFGLGLGASLAFDRRRGPSAVPVRSAIGAMSAALAGLVAALVFAGSLGHLVRTPRLYGLTWDAALGGPQTDARIAEPMLSRDARITGLAFGVTAVGFEIDGKPVDAELIDPPVKGSSGAVVLEGRAPSASDELALGTETLRELHLRVGSRVTAGVVGGPRLPMHVVGRVVVEPASGSAQPGTGFANELRLGHGVLATYSGIAARDPAAVPPAEAFLRFARHVGAQAAAAQLAPTIGRDVVPTAFTPPRNLIAFARVENLPWVLSGVLGAVALVTLAHILLVSITRRRRDLAILKTLGLVGTDVMAAVVWQALLLAGVAVVVSAVIGVSGGRWLWDFLLRGVGIVADPRWSPAVLAVSELSVLVVAFTIALVPAWLAARVRPARILRTE